MRWGDYVLASDEAAAVDLWRAARDASSGVTYALGVGFDPRALVGLRALLDSIGPDRLEVVTVGLAEGTTAPAGLESAHKNQEELKGLGLQDVSDTPPLPEADVLMAGLGLARRVRSQPAIRDGRCVLVDISSLPPTVYFPLIGVLLDAAERTEVSELMVVVCDNPMLDAAITAEGIADPGPIGGFRNGLTLETEGQVTRVWAPVLGDGASASLERVFTYLNPSEVCPVLPFPAPNPRHADDLAAEFQTLLFEVMEADPRDVIYAHETNPFDLYRTLLRLNERFGEALRPLGEVKTVTSVHGSKTLSLGALLAAWEQQLPVVAAPPTGYSIQDGSNLAELSNENRLSCLWLAGEPYRAG